ncbi:aldehyde dehydrogenase (NADP(+)) [Parvularcula marina]|uniref:Aldehyde dehydrogenase (NADP(+)) n=1 Tax=Parvularcula marina TaxID=2292771 RepID=A0A371RHC5_9PROT|nr:aldehyde dehydrogenase (NADP(+)) [Parvularcula marina]RFB04857.1 aldehyde dehydrogenase (NADP(+)) [Parvularcula marina]
MAIEGVNLIGGEARQGKGPEFSGVAAASGETLAPVYREACPGDVAEAARHAGEASPVFAALSPEARASFLETVADRLEAARAEIVPRAMAESALPEARLNGELGRTIGQFRLFAEELRNGECFSIRIDPALPDRAPLPRPDMRLRKIPLGPVAVFGASNFPLAFSVAGGDTASALAAGCPVIAKAHPAHPGTSELAGKAINEAVRVHDLPAGTFALVHGGVEIGTSLVSAPEIKAVGFTGSQAGGLALAEVAAARPDPIPVYAEMSSINPVVILPAALSARGGEIGEGLAASTTLGAGQFCTNPGLVFVIDEAEADYLAFRDAVAAAIGGNEGAAMLTAGIASAYQDGVAALAGHPDVKELARGAAVNPCQPAALMETTAAAFRNDIALHREVFGAVSLIVRCSGLADVFTALAAMEGQLTATLQMEDTDMEAARDLLPLLERKAGRILVNGFPTGVEVCHAMVHGGPYPATTDARTTSVGTLAIDRFLRPVCYQNFPEGLLPEMLRDANPDALPRRVDGKREG